MKFSDKMVADSGSFTPFLAGPDEFVLASIGLAQHTPGERIVLSFEIGWERLFEWDSGDLEILIREGSETGNVLYWIWSPASCGHVPQSGIPSLAAQPLHSAIS